MNDTVVPTVVPTTQQRPVTSALPPTKSAQSLRDQEKNTDEAPQMTGMQGAGQTPSMQSMAKNQSTPPGASGLPDVRSITHLQNTPSPTSETAQQAHQSSSSMRSMPTTVSYSGGNLTPIPQGQEMASGMRPPRHHSGSQKASYPFPESSSDAAMQYRRALSIPNGGAPTTGGHDMAVPPKKTTSPNSASHMARMHMLFQTAQQTDLARRSQSMSSSVERRATSGPYGAHPYRRRVSYVSSYAGTTPQRSNSMAYGADPHAAEAALSKAEFMHFADQMYDKVMRGGQGGSGSQPSREHMHYMNHFLDRKLKAFRSVIHDDMNVLFSDLHRRMQVLEKANGISIQSTSGKQTRSNSSSSRSASAPHAGGSTAGENVYQS